MDLLNALKAVDLGTIVMTVGLCALWAVVGFNICKARHRQRGIEVDDRVPDFVPSDWGPKVGV